MTPSILHAPRIIAAAPLLSVAIALATGIAAGQYLSPPAKLTATLTVVVALAALVIRASRIRLGLAILAIVLGGAFLHNVRRASAVVDRVRTMCDDGRLTIDEPVGIDGVVGDVPEDAPGGLFFELETAAIIKRGVASVASGRIRVFLARSNDSDVRPVFYDSGERLRLYCALNRADEFLNPGVVRRPEILDRQQLDATCSVKSELLVERLAPAHGFSPMTIVRNARAALIELFRTTFDTPTAGVMIASLLGSKRFLDKDTATVFREGGTFHVLVISGLHITFIGGLVLATVGFATRRRTARFIVTSFVLWTFAVGVGAEVPIVRAAVMFTVVLFADVVFREPNPLNSLALSAIVLLAWRPDDLFSQSFQLTFASVAAIVCGAFPLLRSLRAIGEWRPSATTPFPPNVASWLVRFCETIYWRDRMWNSERSRNAWSAAIVKKPFFKLAAGQYAVRFIFEGTLVSLVVQITLLPLSVLFFNRVSTSSILLNLWVGFIIAVETFTACAALLLQELSETLAIPLVMLTEFLNALLLAVPRAFIEGDLAGIRVPAYSGPASLVYSIYFVPVIVLFAAASRWNPFELIRERSSATIVSAVLLTTLIPVVIFHPFSAPPADGRLRVDFLDVGQGDAALITFPDGRTMLVDGGGRPRFDRIVAANSGDDGHSNEPFTPDSTSIGEAVVSKFLWNRGLSRIDYILATHADADHIQGLADVAQNFEVGAAFFGRTPASDPDFAALESVLERRGVESVTLSRGDRFEIAGVDIAVLWPRYDDSTAASSGNNDSLVLSLKFGARTFLLTGDIERETETSLALAHELPATNIVKVAHHGSRTSSTAEFVAATHPDYAIISVGRTSRFGHPHPEIVGRWKLAGAVTMTTGDRGTITASTDGRELRIESYEPKRRLASD